VQPSPGEIRNRRFPIRRRGYDPDEVTAFLHELAAALDELEQRLAEQPEPRDHFDDAGREVAEVLRAAHAESTRTRVAAHAEAEAIRAEAQLHAAEVKAEAQEDREKAKRLLVRSRTRAESLVAEAEDRAAGLAASAEAQARTRVDSLVDAGRRRLEEMRLEEQHAQRRLLDAQRDLQAVIARVAAPTPVIDLTSDDARVRPAPSPRSDSEATPPTEPTDEKASPSPTPPEAPQESDEEVGREDPLTAMVRKAVDRAVEASSDPD
jgi:DivIVA domain-containing protein